MIFLIQKQNLNAHKLNQFKIMIQLKLVNVEYRAKYQQQTNYRKKQVMFPFSKFVLMRMIMCVSTVVKLSCCSPSIPVNLCFYCTSSPNWVACHDFPF